MRLKNKINNFLFGLPAINNYKTKTKKDKRKII